MPSARLPGNPAGAARGGLVRSHAGQLARIEAALERMDAGLYGLCTQCEARIPIGRLEADPAVASCGECEEPSDRMA